MTERSQVASKSICVWLQMGALALAALLAAQARAQTQMPYPNPPGGVPASPPASPPQSAPTVPSVNGVYQDAASNACDSKSGFSLNVGGFSPAFCKAETMETTGTGAEANKCFPIGGGDTFLVGQKGNTCYYCQSLPVSPYLNLNWIVVPMDAGNAAYKQGFACAMAESDSCYMTCDGSGPFNPPAGVTLMPPVNFGGTGQTQQLKAFVTNTPDPCYPAGPKNYDVCDYPNLARPAGCECTKSPGPAPAVLEQQPSNTTPKTSSSARAGTCSSLFALLRTATFTSNQVSYLTQDVFNAKVTVGIANSYISPAQWDAGTLALATKYFGNASPQTQATLRQNVKNVLATLNGITSVTSTIYPTGAEVLAPEVSANCIAYVHAPDTPDKRNLNKIFLCSSFWDQPQTGPDSQAMVLVHEVSHLPGGANTRDYAYGATDCGALVTFTTTGLGKVGSLISQEKLTDKSPKLVDLTEKAPLENADSFKYFVYDVANQLMPAAK